MVLLKFDIAYHEEFTIKIYILFLSIKPPVQTRTGRVTHSEFRILDLDLLFHCNTSYLKEIVISKYVNTLDISAESVHQGVKYNEMILYLQSHFESPKSSCIK